VGDEVLVSVPGLPDDHLGVEHDEAAEDGQADVQVSLEKQLGSEEDVEKAKDEESGESREESAAKIEVLAIRGEQGSAGEASEYGRGEHEGGGHKRGVHHDCHGEEGAQAESSEKGEGHEHGEAGAAVLPVVRGHEQAKGNPSAKEGEDQASALEDVGEEVHVGASRGGHDGHGEGGVDIFQVAPHWRLKLGVERVQKVLNTGSHPDT